MTKAPNPWVMLGVGMAAQVVGTVAANSPIFLIAHFHLDRGMSLTTAGWVVTTAAAGVMVSLIAWGWIVDRIGERLSLTAGLALVTAASVVAAGLTDSAVGLAAAWFAVGVGAASTNSASGRLVIGWFPAHRRGTAMGIRQTALPLGMGLAALITPNVTEALGLDVALLLIAAATGVTSLVCMGLVVDPPRVARADASAADLANPYRGSVTLLRIHLASALLVVPQLTVWTFMLVWLIDARHWTTFAATALVAGTQVLGAFGRVGAGWWSDRVGSRLRPMRQVAVAAAVTMVALGLVENTAAAVAMIVVATVVTVTDNGLAFTAVAERGGPFWAGRAMGVQNTGQYLTGALVPPVIGAVVTAHGYGIAFACTALFPVVAIALVPVKDETAFR